LLNIPAWGAKFSVKGFSAIPGCPGVKTDDEAKTLPMATDEAAAVREFRRKFLLFIFKYV
jgi:hypothetical protein